MKKTNLLIFGIGLFMISCKTEKTPAYIGRIEPRTTKEIENNNWTIGCEVLDRDYANYQNYKTYLDSLGCKTARIQAGWAKTEKIKGRYDFSWLDTIVDDLLRRKICPWMQFSYGNPMYKGGGEPSLAGGIPSSPEALAAWDKWVEASMMHFKDRVNYYEIWNESNLFNRNSPETYAALYIRTAEIIRRNQPEAKISALAVAGIYPTLVKTFLDILKKENKIHLVDEITYHPYHAIPESSYGEIDSIVNMLPVYGSHITIKQGENGCPSTLKSSGALRGLPWNEQTQAKWYLRRFISDACHNIPSSIFTIMDFSYPSDQITVGWNTKGLIKADTNTGKALCIKPAYRAVQHIVSIFDNKTERIADIKYTIDTTRVPDTLRWLFRPRSYFSVYAFKNKENGKKMAVVWMGGSPAYKEIQPIEIGIAFESLHFINPELVDMLSGKIYSIPEDYLDHFIVSDYPVLIRDGGAK